MTESNKMEFASIHRAALRELIRCLKESGMSKDMSAVVCLSLWSWPYEMDNLSLFILKNRPTHNEIMEKFDEIMCKHDPTYAQMREDKNSVSPKKTKS